MHEAEDGQQFTAPPSGPWDHLVYDCDMYRPPAGTWNHLLYDCDMYRSCLRPVPAPTSSRAVHVVSSRAFPPAGSSQPPVPAAGPWDHFFSDHTASRTGLLTVPAGNSSKAVHVVSSRGFHPPPAASSSSNKSSSTVVSSSRSSKKPYVAYPPPIICSSIPRRSSAYGRLSDYKGCVCRRALEQAFLQVPATWQINPAQQQARLKWFLTNMWSSTTSELHKNHRTEQLFLGARFVLHNRKHNSSPRACRFKAMVAMLVETTEAFAVVPPGSFEKVADHLITALGRILHCDDFERTLSFYSLFDHVPTEDTTAKMDALERRWNAEEAPAASARAVESEGDEEKDRASGWNVLDYSL